MSVVVENTVFPPSSAEEPQLRHFAALLESDAELALITPDGQRLELTGQLRDVLAHASRVMIEGQALAPLDAVLSTQEAADELGVSRPTLVKLLESEAITFTKPGRHRRVQLRDLRHYQQRVRQHRREELDAMTQEAAEDDGYTAVNGFTETR